MSLEEYTNLDRDGAFVYWLEAKAHALGSIWGGSAFKFGMFRRDNKDPKQPKGGRVWGDEYAWMRKYGETAEAAFATVRSRLTDVIDAVEAGNLEAVDQVDFSPAVKWKVAFLYQDRKAPRLLAIYKEPRLAARYNEVFPNAAGVPPSQQHAALIEHYSWLGNALDISPEIWLDPKEQPPPPPPGDLPTTPPADRRYWLMSLGRQSRRWPACRESGIASMGYDDYRVDLGQYSSQEEVGRAIGSESGQGLMNTRRALWEFSHVMKPGDVIFVKRGNNAIGHGTVRSDYRYDAARDSYRHVRDVKWESNFPDGVRVREKPLVVKTLTDITKYPDQVRAFKEAIQSGGLKASHPRNQILYGPPGTGKTYDTLSHALAVVDGVDVDTVREGREEDPEAALERYSELRFKSPAGGGGRPKGRLAMVTFHQNYAYEDFVEGIRPQLTKAESGGGDVDSAKSGSTELGYELRHGSFRSICEVADDARKNAEKNSDETPPYVLIIDEINRGNIPKIFGELITLIEDSRRLGAKDETRVTLPYSGDEFGVPNNLYIIGTMNTADRSIQQLDTALRRRFTFVEMMPEPNHRLVPKDVDGVNCQEMLRAMNKRIAVLMDREHQIGHTYLFNVRDLADLADRFQNRIFPLLQEYFYDDWRKIKAVLGGNAFVQKIGEGQAKNLVRDFDLVDDDAVIYERLPLNDPDWKNAGQYRKIYESPGSD